MDVKERLIFVAFDIAPWVTLAVIGFAVLEHFAARSFRRFVETHRSFHIPVAAAIATIPGCGGIIQIVMSYKRAIVTFPALAAAAIAAIGDSAPILWAASPKAAAILQFGLLTLGIGVGMLLATRCGQRIVAGFNRLLRCLPTPSRAPQITGNDRTWPFRKGALFLRPAAATAIYPFAAMLGAAVVMRVAQIFGINVIRSDWMLNIAIALFISSALAVLAKHASHACGLPHQFDELAYIIFWVTTVQVASAALFSERAFPSIGGMFGVVIGVTIALIPGCAPQIAIFTLWTQGLVPLELFVANAVAEDGDGTLVLLASDPRSAVTLQIIRGTLGLLAGTTVLLLT